jgi:hypothetical protein
MSARSANEQYFGSDSWYIGAVGVVFVALAAALAYSDRFVSLQTRRDVVYIVFELAFFTIGTIAIGGWAYLALYRVRISADEIKLYTGPFRMVVAWDDVVAVYGAIPLRTCGHPITLGTCCLRLADGRRVWVPDTVANFDILADRIHEAVLSRLWSVAESTYRSDGELEFGPVTLRSDGIHAGGRFVPWRSFRGFIFPFPVGISVSCAEIRFFAGSENHPWFTVLLSELPNAHMFLTLARMFAQAAGTEIRCQGTHIHLTFPPLDAAPTVSPGQAPEPPKAVPNHRPSPSRTARTTPAGAAPPGPVPQPAIPKSLHDTTWRSILTCKSEMATVFFAVLACFFAGMCVVGVGVSLYTGRHSPHEYFCLLLPSGVCALGAYLAGRTRIIAIAVSDEGLIVAKRSRTTRRVWDEIKEVYIAEIRVRRNRTAWCRLVFADGQELAVRMSLSGYDAFLRSVQRAVTGVWLPVARRAIAAGVQVSFGPVKITSHGIGTERTAVMWHDVERVYVATGHLMIRLPSSRTYQWRLRDIPNYCVLLNLIHDLVGKRLEAFA